MTSTPAPPPTPAGLRIEIVPRAALPAAHLDAVAALCERAYEEDLRAAVAADPAGYALGALAPSDPAFYARVGWASWRGPLFAAGPDGRVAPTPDGEVMVLPLPATRDAVGALDLARPLVAPWREGDLW
jgi:hypothetical protein